jgi:nitroimidazol reductase NimA-like FMN-containing flavoprotein (pyridoxamine 5'-phosphate oxidase superfamily)
MPQPGPPSERTQVRRIPQRGRYDASTVHAILDEGMLCFVAVAVDDQPFVVPMAYGRHGDHLFLHGARASRLMQRLAAGAETCVTVAHLDGLVLARSLFHHSMNYRSVMVLGQPFEVVDPDAKRDALIAIAEHLIPGRTQETRLPNDRELAATTVAGLSLAESSAKVRTGPPLDDDDDLALPHWAGILPLTLATGSPVPDAHVPAGAELPLSLKTWKRNSSESGGG